MARRPPTLPARPVRPPADSAPADTRHAEPVPAEPEFGFERMVFFSDAVFAIVITLLVLPLTGDIELPDGAGGLAGQVLRLWPTVLTFVVSFLVIGQFWIAHHRTFGHLHRTDTTLMWLNLISLLTVAFMPFPAALLGAHSADEGVFPVVFYAAAMTVTSAALTATWLYAVTRGLTKRGPAPAEARQVTRRAVTTTVVFAASVGVAFLGLTAAVVCWLVVLPAARTVVTRADR